MNTKRAMSLSLLALGAGVSLVACGTATGSASKPAASTTISTTAQTAPVSINESIQHGPQQRPSELDFYEHTNMTGINWSSWGGDTAQGAGTVGDDNCTPDCASGGTDSYPAHIVLSDVKTVNGTREYTHYSVTLDKKPTSPDLAKALTDQSVKPW